MRGRGVDRQRDLPGAGHRVWVDEAGRLGEGRGHGAGEAMGAVYSLATLTVTLAMAAESNGSCGPG